MDQNNTVTIRNTTVYRVGILIMQENKKGISCEMIYPDLGMNKSAHSVNYLPCEATNHDVLT